MTHVRIVIQNKQGVFDPQGKVVQSGLERLGFESVHHARVGKVIDLQIDQAPGPDLDAKLHEMCRKLLANPVIEDYTLQIVSHADKHEGSP